MAKGRGNIDQTAYSPPFIDKVFATKNCMWCNADFDKFRIVCNSCANCQYCGMVPVNTQACNLCGNRLPADQEAEGHKRKRIPKTRFV